MQQTKTKARWLQNATQEDNLQEKNDHWKGGNNELKITVLWGRKTQVITQIFNTYLNTHCKFDDIKETIDL